MDSKKKKIEKLYSSFSILLAMQNPNIVKRTAINPEKLKVIGEYNTNMLPNVKPIIQ